MKEFLLLLSLGFLAACSATPPQNPAGMLPESGKSTTMLSCVSTDSLVLTVTGVLISLDRSISRIEVSAGCQLLVEEQK
mgnify:FL=1